MLYTIMSTLTNTICNVNNIFKVKKAQKVNKNALNKTEQKYNNLN